MGKKYKLLMYGLLVFNIILVLIVICIALIKIQGTGEMDENVILTWMGKISSEIEMSRL